MSKISVSTWILSGVVSLGATGCLLRDEGGSSGVPGEGVSVELQIREAALSKSAAATAAALTVDSVHVRVTGDGMEPAEFSFGGTNPAVSISDLKAGEDRRFEVKLYLDGRLAYAGETTASLHTDRKNALTVHCLPEFSRITASVHVPLDFPKAVTGGRLVVWNAQDTFSVAPTANGELRNFRLERVTGDRIYSVSLALWDAAGDTLATALREDVEVPKGRSVALVMPLNATFPQLRVSMTVGEPYATDIVLHFPAARRVPQAFGEAVFSELYPAPSPADSSDNGEWLELFNRVSDTLDVSGCQLLRDAGTGTGMQFTLPAGTVIPPGRGLVVGRSAVSFAGVRMLTSPLTLTNTAARLEFSCGAGAVKLDSVSYTTSASDPLAARMAAGKVSSLKPSRLHLRNASDSWCLASPRPEPGEIAATPGVLSGSCGE
jgi:hypothetical protein